MRGQIAEALEIVRALHQAGAERRRHPDRSGRVLPFRHPRQNCPRGDRGSGGKRGRARTRPRIRRQADGGRSGASLANSAQGRGGCEGFASPARFGRNGADPPRLCFRSAHPRGDDPQAEPDDRRSASCAAASVRWRRGRALRCGSRPQSLLRSRPRRLLPAPRRRSPRLARFDDVVALARSKRDIQLVQSLERDVRLARFEQGSIAFTLVEGAESGLAQTLSRRLQEWTGERWMVALVPGSTAPTLRETAQAREAERTSNAASHPLVQKVLDRFKGARIVDVRRPDAPSSSRRARSTMRSVTPIPASTPPMTFEKEIAPWISWA